MAISEDDKSRARGHLGYLEVQEASTFVLGQPAGVQTQFIIEGAWARLLPQAEKRFRQLLDRLDALEQQIEDNSENLAVDELGDIKVRADEFKEIVRRYIWWRAKLGNMLGVTPNPFDQRFNAWGMGGGGGINVSVRH